MGEREGRRLVAPSIYRPSVRPSVQAILHLRRLSNCTARPLRASLLAHCRPLSSVVAVTCNFALFLRVWSD